MEQTPDAFESGPPAADEPLAAAPLEDAAQTGAPEEAAAAADTLSPAVRRLVRQYDLDVTGIHGSGPDGRIRVGDVIAMLGARSDAAARAADAARGQSAFGDDTIVEARSAGTPYRGAAPARERVPAAAAPAAPAATVFECDLSRVLAHRKAQRRDDFEILLTSYFLVACGEALRAVAEVVADEDCANAQLGVAVASPEGERTTLVDALDTVDDAGPLASLNDRLRSFDQALRAIDDAPLDAASLLVHHYGGSGSLLATPTPLGAGHVASVGIGRVRRQIVVKSGEDAPRVAAICYVSLTYLPDRLPLARANRFVGEIVRVLEQWPD